MPCNAHRLLPQKSSVGPALFGEFLHLVCITELIAPRNMQIRFAGSEFERLAGFGSGLKNYYDLLPDKFVGSTENFRNLIRSTPCGAFVGDVITATSGNQYLHETIHLPLVNEAGIPKYLLVYDVGRKPFGDQPPGQQATIPNPTSRNFTI